MEAITPALIAVGCLNLLMFPVLAFLIKRYLGQKLDTYDEKRERARKEAENAREESRLWRKAMERGMRSMLRAELISEHAKWTDLGYCPTDPRGHVTRCHQAYNDLGGNSFGDDLYEQVSALPLYPPKKKEE